MHPLFVIISMITSQVNILLFAIKENMNLSPLLSQGDCETAEASLPPTADCLESISNVIGFAAG